MSQEPASLAAYLEELERLDPLLPFGDALSFAWSLLDPAERGTGGDMGPLADYLAAIPLTMEQQQALADLLRLVPGKMTPGNRGPRAHPRPRITEAEMDVARRIVAERAEWLRQNPCTKAGKPRKNVPAHLIRQWIVAELNAEDSPSRDRTIHNITNYVRNWARL